jgi:hypothetical protein
MYQEHLSFLLEKTEEEVDLYFLENPFWYLFYISGLYGSIGIWAYGQLKQLVPEFKKPNKNLDPEYSNQYNLWLDWVNRKNEPNGIRIEVKTSRAVDFEKPDEPLYIKALASDSKRPFDMNFQQIKPRCADVFVWIAVWRDIIRYWVLNRDEIQNNKYFSKGQHRGNIGEGQLHLKRDNISEFKQYEVRPPDIKGAVIRAYKGQYKLK